MIVQIRRADGTIQPLIIHTPSRSPRGADLVITFTQRRRPAWGEQAHEYAHTKNERRRVWRGLRACTSLQATGPRKTRPTSPASGFTKAPLRRHGSDYVVPNDENRVRGCVAGMACQTRGQVAAAGRKRNRATGYGRNRKPWTESGGRDRTNARDAGTGPAHRSPHSGHQHEKVLPGATILIPLGNATATSIAHRQVGHSEMKKQCMIHRGRHARLSWRLRSDQNRHHGVGRL